MKTNKVFALLLVLVMLFALSACSSSSKLVGQWVKVDGRGPYSVMVLREDGTAVYDDGMAGQWVERDGVIAVADIWEGGNGEYYYDVSGKTLTLTDTNNSERVSTYEKTK